MRLRTLTSPTLALALIVTGPAAASATGASGEGDNSAAGASGEADASAHGAGGGADLPRTGIELATSIGIAAAIIALGTALVLFTRRRRS